MIGELFGPYRLESPLGRGAMGEVWRAVDTRDDRVVALKLIATELSGDGDFEHRFRRESKLAARLSNPHIVPIHDHGEIDGRLYLDMQLVEGTDLARLLAMGPLPPTDVVAIITQTASALEAAHRDRVVHRDVKPSNILVGIGDDVHTYLIDFGIARAADSTQITRYNHLVGTLAYMAPERFAGKGDHRSDIYALGCVLHEALTGQRAFPGTDNLKLLNDHQNALRPRPSALRRDLPPAWDTVVARALAQNPDLRYQTAGEFAAAVREAGSVRPLSPTVVDRARPRLDRRDTAGTNRYPLPPTFPPSARVFPAQPLKALGTILSLTAVLWVVEFYDQLTGERLDQDGIVPRSVDGLDGIVWVPLLHGGWAHLVANTLPFLVFGFLVLANGVARFVLVTAVIWVVAGLGVWLTAPAGSVTVGMSGVIFGWLTYLLVRGFFARSGTQIVLALVVFFLWGGILLGVLPGQEGVSWQGHLFGALAGVVAAWLVARPRHPSVSHV